YCRRVRIAVAFRQRIMYATTYRALAQFLNDTVERRFMSYVRIWVHVVFTTHNHEQSLASEIRAKLIAHIRENCRQKDIYLDRINGWSDHLHLLISLGREQNIAKVMMLIKGESAHWLNEENLLRGKFGWQ